MSHKVKIFLIYFVSFIVIFTIVRYLIGLIIPQMEHLYLMITAAIITVVLSPRLDKDQNGRYVLKSVFRKEPLIK
ncbi:hypothetical protein [Gramella sp. MAR_2010_147]|uniref:hypothetical protein n=1 Tax=Gramella sp. MAR_2010_147 TaxID=1250205 RepID=UPI00087CA726|nr:hypothetical protein [Gramella sp. MAR_2010_147]SDR95096.1 hypothetical protein SAMN04488553_1109 [Gramella sp. MAR_2010_147]